MTILPYMRSEVTQSCVTLCNPRLEPIRPLHPWNFPGKSTGVGFHFLLQGIFPTQGLNSGLPYCGHMLFLLSHQGSPLLPYICNHSLIYYSWILNSVQLFSHVQLFATPRTVAYKVPPSMAFSRQEYWGGFPFPSPGDLPDPGIELRPPVLWAYAFPSEPPGKPTSALHL